MTKKKFRVTYGEIRGWTAFGQKIILANDYDDALDKWSESRFFCRNPTQRQPLEVEERKHD